MKGIKTLASLAICLGLLFGLAGCESRDKQNSSSTSMSSSSSVPSEPSSSPGSGSSSSMPSSSEGGDSSASTPSTTSSTMDESSSSAAEPTAAAAGSADFSQIGALDASSVTWGPGRQVDADNRPTAPIGLQEKYGKYGCLFIGPPADKTIYLTFDQGYENGFTTTILDTLKEKQVPATFFLTGHYLETAPELVRRMIDEGHALGNHSYKHYDCTEVPLEKASEDMLSLSDALKEQYQYDCKLYRFPEGKFSEQSLALVQQNGMRAIFWSFAYNDWDPENQMAEEEALQELTSRTHNGAVYLLHSVGATNNAVLGRFIDAARQQGYAFAPLPVEQ